MAKISFSSNSESTALINYNNFKQRYQLTFVHDFSVENAAKFVLECCYKNTPHTIYHALQNDWSQ